MAQFIQYLYEYENGKKVRNLGFMKVEKQMDKSVIQIYAKQIDEIKGIWFQRENGSRYMAAWEDAEGDMMEIPRDVESMEKPSQREERPVETPRSEKTVTEALQREEYPMETPHIEEIVTKVPQREERPMEIPRSEERPGKTQEPEEEPEEEVDDYSPPKSCHCEKIQRQDLSRLPRREWRLANNSFLLHGFYNYHHLLYIEEEDRTWIGVPGIYHEKEKMAANAFGFTEFRRRNDLDVELSPEEQNTYDDFGYWCRQVSR